MTEVEVGSVDENMTDDKFVVFKRSDWEARCQQQGLSLLPEQIVTDAVVIRRRDAAAPAVFEAYAAFYEGVIQMLEAVTITHNDQKSSPITAQHLPSLVEMIANCRRVADYFADQAHLSWLADRKIPTP